MKILLTGSTGYIGRRLLPALLAEGHEVICLVRDKRRFDWEDFSNDDLSKISVIEGDLSQSSTMASIPVAFDVAYYLVHSMIAQKEKFAEADKQRIKANAQHFA